MKKLALLAVLLLLGAGSCRAEGDWEELSDENGIRVWRRETDGSPIVALRGEAVIDAPLARVASVLDDTPRQVEWACNTVEAKVVRAISPTERIVYNLTHAPWPVADRDFVFHAVVTPDRKERTLTYELHSVEDKGMPPDEDKAVRGELIDSRYVLKELEGGKTRLTVTIQADPKGSVPKWVVNLAQKAWPRETIEGLRAQCAKADVKDLALANEWLDGTVAALASSTDQH